MRARANDKKTVLVTGGGGFIGSHFVDLLVEKGYAVTVMDMLEKQVHGKASRPEYLNPKARFIKGDVKDRAAIRKALKGQQVVAHLAAQVGVGQSMYEIDRYVADNCVGTGILLEEVIKLKTRPERLLVASSMSIYGEGAYRCAGCGVVAPGLRLQSQLEAGDWEPRCPGCGSSLTSIPTAETKPLAPTSVYAVTKRDQEELCLSIGRAYDLPTLAFRFFNAYGPRQSLSNPYTGVAAIFAGRLLNGNPPLVFEDGGQSRDFIHVSDIARGLLLGIERTDVPFGAFNLGTGKGTSVLEVAKALAEALKSSVRAKVLGKFRQGDIRHCYADITRAKDALGFSPKVSFEAGIRELLGWLKTQRPVDRVEAAYKELKSRGLAV